jgi:hypothetical protein
MSQLDAAADPFRAMERGLYVSHSREIARQIATRAELQPSSTHLIIGGIGSGKTTQLLATLDRLTKLGDTVAVYVDVSKEHDLGKIRPGVLAALTGLALGKKLGNAHTKESKKAFEEIERWAYGYGEWVEDDSYYEPPDDEPPDYPDYDEQEYPPQRYVQHPGLISPPRQPLSTSIETKLVALSTMRKALSVIYPHFVILLDSLDRVTNPKVFFDIIQQDVQAISQCGIGVILVGPLRMLYGEGRNFIDAFDHFYFHSAIDIEDDENGLTFLLQVLRARAPEQILPEEPAERIAKLSGGVLRDLISIARSAGEEAYLAGTDKIEISHVLLASEAFGRNLVLGIDRDGLKILQQVHQRGKFVPTSDKEMSLLATRRVLHYAPNRFRVHPTIVPLLRLQQEVE